MTAPRIRMALIGALLASACTRPERVLESSRRYMSVTYNDTTLESFSRTDRAITGSLVSAHGDSVSFRIRTAADGLVSGADITLHPATSRADESRTAHVAMPEKTLPVIATSVALLEQLLRRARVVGGDNVSIPVMILGSQASLDVLTMIKNGSDSVVFVGPDGNLAAGIHLAVDAQGRILGGVIPLSGTRILNLDASQ